MSDTLRSLLLAALTASSVAVMAWAGCSTAPAQRNAEAPQANCFNACANNFALCTEDSGGDFADCSRQRNECRSDCEAQNAERREEEGDVFLEGEEAPEIDEAPVEAPELEGPGIDTDEQGE